MASAARSSPRTVLDLRGSERRDPDLVWTPHDPEVWSRERCLIHTVLQHSTSASNPAAGAAFWTLGYLTVTAEFVKTATKTSCVRDAW